ncbi:MAG TPA: DsrE family protein [Acidimicrobiales bacterium]|nr:DsrE family protein [Acidimicrobiales bacterium]
MPMKLIFFVAANPAADAGRLTAAYHFATAAADAALDTEVRLAGDAVLAADPAFLATVPGAHDLRSRIDTAPSRGVDVSVCPKSTESRGVNREQVEAMGARPRSLTEILVEVAQGRSVLVHVG